MRCPLTGINRLANGKCLRISGGSSDATVKSELMVGSVAGLSSRRRRSTGDLHQMPGAFDRAGPVGPLDVSFVADDGFDHPVSTFQYPESADQIDLGPHRNSRAAGIEQAA